MTSNRERTRRRLVEIEAPNESAPLVRTWLRCGFLRAFLRPLQSISSENRPIINNIGFGHVSSTNLNINIVVNVDAPRGISPNGYGRAVRASIRAELAAEGLAGDQLWTASNTTVVDEALRRPSSSRAQNQGIPSDTSLNYARSLALPWKHRLKPVWGSIIEAICQLSERTLSAGRTPTMTAVVGLGLLAGQSLAIPLAYTAGTFALFALGNPYGLFRSPTVPHFIIVVDFFDQEVQIPFSEATSSAVCHGLR